jgi:pimeloyl-ACP methyl ester carboxylesterase
MNSDRVRLSLRTDAPAAMLMRRARRAPCAAQCRALAVLAHRWVPSPPPAVGPTAPPARALGGVLVCLHGILGSKSNWLTPARKMLDAADRLRGAGAAEWRALCLDHRGHADSADSPPGADPEAPVAAGGGGKDRVAVGIGVCADDVEETLRTLGLVGAAGDVPIVIVGHSFGGKVCAAACLRARALLRRVP